MKLKTSGEIDGMNQKTLKQIQMTNQKNSSQ